MNILNNFISTSPDESDAVLQFKGTNGDIYLFENHFEIKRHPLHQLSRLDPSESHSLPLSKISEIHFRRKSNLKKGYIRFIENGKDASYLSTFSIDHDDGTVQIARNNNDFALRFIRHILKLEPSIDIIDLDDPTIKDQNKDIVDKIVDGANSGKKVATETLKDVDKDKLASNMSKVAILIGTKVIKKKLKFK